MIYRIIYFLVAVVTGGIVDWLDKRRLKRQLREGLGHEVEDSEVTSLKRWMEMPSNNKLPPKTHAQEPRGIMAVVMKVIWFMMLPVVVCAGSTDWRTDLLWLCAIVGIPMVIVAIFVGWFSNEKTRSIERGMQEALAEPYKNKYLVVVREGLVVGTRPHQRAASTLVVQVTDAGAYHSEHSPNLLRRMFHRGASESMQLHPGDVLKVTHARFWFSPDFLVLVVQTVSPRSTAQGLGAQEHESQDVGTAEFQFQVGDNFMCDEEIDPLVEKWVKIFDTQEDAAKFGAGLIGQSSGR